MAIGKRTAGGAAEGQAGDDSRQAARTHARTHAAAPLAAKLSFESSTNEPNFAAPQRQSHPHAASIPHPHVRSLMARNPAAARVKRGNIGTRLYVLPPPPADGRLAAEVCPNQTAFMRPCLARQQQRSRVVVSRHGQGKRDQRGGVEWAVLLLARGVRSKVRRWKRLASPSPCLCHGINTYVDGLALCSALPLHEPALRNRQAIAVDPCRHHHERPSRSAETLKPSLVTTTAAQRDTRRSSRPPILRCNSLPRTRLRHARQANR